MIFYQYKSLPRNVVKYDKSSLQRIDWDIVTFILKYLYENSYEKKTRLSMCVGLQYSRFLRYVKWLQLVDWIDVIKKDNSNVLVLTDDGIIICNKLQGESKEII